tara:strand:+ start:155 stop:760 length:606 start_codon:yes stop_codon:yes gene_type:complete
MSIVTLNNRALKDATAVGSITGLGDLIFISRSTASSSASLSITSGIDSTYKEYIFVFNNMHPETDDQKFTFNFSIDSGSNYNVTKTTAAFRAYHTEDDSATNLSYRTGDDLAQSTDFQGLTGSVGNDNDQSCSGVLHLFDPSNTTFTKHFMSTVQQTLGGNSTRQDFIAGYANTTSAVDAIQFKFASGNIDSGTIDLYGVN